MSKIARLLCMSEAAARSFCIQVRGQFWRSGPAPSDEEIAERLERCSSRLELAPHDVAALIARDRRRSARRRVAPKARGSQTQSGTAPDRGPNPSPTAVTKTHVPQAAVPEKVAVPKPSRAPSPTTVPKRRVLPAAVPEKAVVPKRRRARRRKRRVFKGPGPVVVKDRRGRGRGVTIRSAETCPHGVPRIKLCAICDPEAFKRETGI